MRIEPETWEFSFAQPEALDEPLLCWYTRNLPPLHRDSCTFSLSKVFAEDRFRATYQALESQPGANNVSERGNDGAVHCGYRLLCTIPGCNMQGAKASCNRLLGASPTRLWGRANRGAPGADKSSESRCVRTGFMLATLQSKPQRPENGKTHRDIMPSWVNPNGAVDVEEFDAVWTTKCPESNCWPQNRRRQLVALS